MAMPPDGFADPFAYPLVRFLLIFYVRVPMTMGETELLGWMQSGEESRPLHGLTHR